MAIIEKKKVAHSNICIACASDHNCRDIVPTGKLLENLHNYEVTNLYF